MLNYCPDIFEYYVSGHDDNGTPIVAPVDEVSVDDDDDSDCGVDGDFSSGSYATVEGRKVLVIGGYSPRNLDQRRAIIKCLRG